MRTPASHAKRSRNYVLNAQQSAASPSESAAYNRVRVFLRCRPMSAKERNGKERKIVKTDTDAAEVLVLSKVKDAPSRSYRFDGVFGSSSSQSVVYNSVLNPIVDEMMMGFNCTVFAYGQTGTGKTYTMEGGLEPGSVVTPEHPSSGMISRAVAHIFHKLETNPDVEYSVRVSHMELYNEELIDLLGVGSKPLKLFEHPKEGVQIGNLEEMPVTNADAIFRILGTSMKKRQTAETKMNATSSRSHCIFTITVHTKETTVEGEEVIRTGKLNLVDLAGSENVGRSGAKKGRKREAGMINQSLLTLGRVITALTEGRPHIPYRESKLTRLLAESLGGRAKTAIIATVSPSSSNFEETLSTLDYASRAKNIKNKPQMNRKTTKKALIKEYVHEIERLKMRVIAAREKNGIFLPPDEFEEMQETLQNQKEAIEDMENQLEMKEKQLEELTEMFTTTRVKLKHTTGVLKETKETLQQTQGSLAETESTLQQTQETLEGTQQVVHRYEEVEEELHSNATQILHTLREREADVEGLHAKVARKQQVESANEEVVRDMQATVTQSVSGMEQSVRSLKEEHSRQAQSIMQGVHAFVEKKQQEMEGLVERLDALQTLFSENQTTLRNILAKLDSDNTRAFAEIGLAETKARNGVGAAVATYIESSTAALSQWRNSLNVQRTEVAAWEDSVQQAVQDSAAREQRWLGANEERLRDFQDQSTAYAQDNQLWAAELAQEMDSAEQRLVQQREQRKTDMQHKIAALFQAFQQRSEQSLCQITSGVQQSSAKQGEVLRQQSSALTQQVREELSERNTRRQRDVERALQSMRQLRAQAYQQREASIAASSAAAEGRTAAVAAMKHAVASSAGRAAQAQQQLVERSAAQRASSLQAHRDAFAAASQQSTAFTQESTEFVMVLRAGVEQHVRDCEQLMEEAEHNNNRWGNAAQRGMNDASDRLDAFFNALQSDVPTGETPQRRHIPYPRRLPTTEPEQDIVARYWDRVLAESSSTASESPLLPSPSAGEKENQTPQTPLIDANNKQNHQQRTPKQLTPKAIDGRSWTVVQLRAYLKQHGLSTAGRKPALLKRVQQAMATSSSSPVAANE